MGSPGSKGLCREPGRLPPLCSPPSQQSRETHRRAQLPAHACNPTHTPSRTQGRENTRTPCRAQVHTHARVHSQTHTLTYTGTSTLTCTALALSEGPSFVRMRPHALSPLPLPQAAPSRVGSQLERPLKEPEG